MQPPQHAQRVLGPGLRCLVARHDLRQHGRGQAQFDQQADPLHPAGLGQHAAHFHGDPLGADDRDLAGHLADRGGRLRIDRKAERGGKADRAEHPQLVFAKPQSRRTDRPDQAVLQVLLPADEVDHLAVDGVEEHAVDGEIAAGGVFAGGTEGDVIGMAAVAVFRVLAEGGHFDHARRPRPQHGDHAESGAQRQGPLVAEQGADFRRRGAGGHVVVLGPAAQQFVADAAARPIGLETGRAEPANHIQGKVDVVVPDRSWQ